MDDYFSVVAQETFFSKSNTDSFVFSTKSSHRDPNFVNFVFSCNVALKQHVDIHARLRHFPPVDLFFLKNFRFRMKL